MALAKKNRLTQKKDFDTIFKKGSAVKGNFLFIRYKKGVSSNSRFAFIVSIKIAGNAVIRNKIKRFLSELVRLNINKIQNNYDVIIMVKRKEENEVLKSELINLLNKAVILQ